MFVYCDKCGYDSGDFESNTDLAKKVLEDGGLMLMTQQGWHIECPNGHNGHFRNLNIVAMRFAPEQIVHMRIGDDRKTFRPYGEIHLN
jgi:hypothetical protein